MGPKKIGLAFATVFIRNIITLDTSKAGPTKELETDICHERINWANGTGKSVPSVGGWVGWVEKGGGGKGGFQILNKRYDMSSYFNFIWKVGWVE